MLMDETFNRVVCTKGKHPCFYPLPINQLQENDRQKLIRSLTKTRTTHSRPQSPSFLGHVVGKRGRLQIKPSGSGDENEDDYENEIFSILSSARAWTCVVLAGKRDSRCQSTTSFSVNVLVTETGYQVLEVLWFCDVLLLNRIYVM